MKYLAKRDIEALAPEKVELGKMPARSIEFMESDELSRLLKAPQGDSLEKLRDRAMLELLFSTGLRVSELVSLNRDSVDVKKDEFSVRGKGDRIRVVFLSPAAKHALKQYLEFAGVFRRRRRRNAFGLIQEYCTSKGCLGSNRLVSSFYP